MSGLLGLSLTQKNFETDFRYGSGKSIDGQAKRRRQRAIARKADGVRTSFSARSDPDSSEPKPS